MTERTRMSAEIASEFDGLSLGDKRLDRRARQIAERLSTSPEDSFPRLATTESEREAMYRFFQNDSVAWEQILAPHVRATADRCERESLVRVAHDSTSFAFVGEREGLGRVGAKNGFFAHVALAITNDETRAPLGALGMQPFTQQSNPGLSRREKHEKSRLKERKQKQSYRWAQLVDSCEAAVGPRATLIHVMDQEADDYALLADLIDRGCRFVVRGTSGRRTAPSSPGKVQDALDAVSTSILRTVTLSRRIKQKGSNKVREEREAKLHVRSSQVTLRRPEWSQSKRATLVLNVVQVFEPKPPEGEAPVVWTLYTTEEVRTKKDKIAVVDHYRARWRIEEFFKSLKTGCAFEKRQLTTLDGLLRALAVFVPIAWRLLSLRTLSRAPTQVKAQLLFDRQQLHLIRTMAEGYKLPSDPTMKDALLAIANIGGHVRSNGDPGWIVLGRGYSDFLKAEIGFRTALKLVQGDVINP